MKEALLVLLAILSLGEASGTKIRGLLPGREKYYDSQKDFSCLDGSDTIPFSYINDDYCDCKYAVSKHAVASLHIYL